MNWKSLFQLSKNMTTDEARAYIKDKPSDSYQLLDVRQPREYETEHLPGAILIPVKELMSRINELDPAKPTLVYCAIGGRSKAAAQMLQGSNFSEVYNISGGIKAWNGFKAKGEESMGLEFFTSGEYKDAFTMAYTMEEGLRQLYLTFAEKCDNPTEKDLLLQLASFEDKHKARLIADFQAAEADIPQVDPQSNIMEGSFSREAIVNHFQQHLHDRQDILFLAMMLETQAHDLYSRVARKSADEKSRKLFLHLAEEEKIHLGFLASELDRLLSAKDHQN
ncbi:MAG: rhodanese-like domain-containing protein [Thermodesulfobacteriota bacterium]